MQGSEGGSLSLWEDEGPVSQWDLTDEDKRELRRPKMTVESKLSADAKEFVPMKNRQNSAQDRQNPAQDRHNSAQDRLNLFKIENNTPNQPLITSNDDFEHLQELIIRATYDPGQFEDIVEPFMDTLGYYIQDEMMISQVAHYLFTYAVDQASFRYNGARLSTVIQEQVPRFIDHLLRLSQQEVNPRPGFILFLAELYVQHNIFAPTLYNSIHTLLQQGGDENVKTVCQTLKLSGRSLDMHSKEQMDSVINKLGFLKNSVMNNIGNLIESVSLLRLNNWGQNPTTPSSSNEQNGFLWNYVPSMEDPIFYGPDGKEMSSDEQRFLAAECGDKSVYDENEDPDDLYDPEPEMDEEIRAGFREFMKMSKNNQKK